MNGFIWLRMVASNDISGWMQLRKFSLEGGLLEVKKGFDVRLELVASRQGYT